jgi:hypothetical protein
MLEDENRDRAKAFAATLGVIEDCFPIVSIGEDYSSRPEMMNQGILDKDIFLDKLDSALPSLLLHSGGDMKALREILASTEPWASQADLVVKHLKDKRW